MIAAIAEASGPVDSGCAGVGKVVGLLVGGIALALAGCGGSSPAPEKAGTIEAGGEEVSQGIPAGASPLDHVLREPELHDLEIPADFFRQKSRGLSDHPGVDTCRVQGLALAGEWLIVSCTVAAGDEPRLRATAEKGHVLAARLTDVLGDGEAPSWRAVQMSERLSPERAAPITAGLQGSEKRERIVAGLMSGMARDVERDGVWVGAAVDARRSHSALHLIDPAMIGAPGALLRSPKLTRKTLELPGERADAMTVVEGRYLLVAVGDSDKFVVFDLEGKGQAAAVINPLLGKEDHVAYRDCETWRGSIIVCAGVAGASSQVHVLGVDAERFPDVRVDLLGSIAGDLTGDGEADVDLGDPGKAGKSDASGEPLIAAGGMALDLDTGHIYFLAGELPGARLVRARLASR